MPILEYLKLEAISTISSEPDRGRYPKRAERFDIVYILYSATRGCGCKTMVADGAELLSTPRPTGWSTRSSICWDSVRGPSGIAAFFCPRNGTASPLRKEYGLTSRTIDGCGNLNIKSA